MNERTAKLTELQKEREIYDSWAKPEETRDKSLQLLASFLGKQLAKLEEVRIDFRQNEVTIKMKKQ